MNPLTILAQTPMPDGFMGWLIAGILTLLTIVREVGRFAGKADKVSVGPQPFDVRMTREFASASALQNHAAKIHARVDTLDSRLTAVVADFNATSTEIKVHLAKMDERSALNHQQLIAMSERLNHVGEDIAALRGRKS